MKDFITQENQSYYLAKGLEFIDPISNGLVGISSRNFHDCFTLFFPTTLLYPIILPPYI